MMRKMKEQWDCERPTIPSLRRPEYAKVAKAAIKKMKRAEQDYRSLLMQYKETKCEMETLNRELTEAYSKIKFLELEVIQANAKVEQVSSKNLNDVLAY